MATTTTIKSTQLDFDTIKANLKTFLRSTNEFSDYNFEASGLSSLLDVLAYNTHYNGLIANYALNESFLPTAQLRSSVVGLAAGLGYIPSSKKGAIGTVNLSVVDPAGPATRTLPADFTFSAVVDNTTYTFRTTQVLTANKEVIDAQNVYNFSINDSTDIQILEGTSKTKTFIAGPTTENESYVIPDASIDLDTAVVKVYDTPSASSSTTYTNINQATAINSSSTIYLLRETPNGFYELTFSNGSNLGISPIAGAKIEVSYLVSNGANANGARTFVPNTTTDGLTVTVTTVSAAAGGSSKEDIESVRKNAPFLFASQNRMVTAEDYSALALRNYNNVISDIKAWGGEDNIPVKYGVVYLSIVFKNGVSAVTQTQTKSGIQNIAKDLSVASFNVEFLDPVETFIRVETIFQFNPKLTSASKSSIESSVTSTVSKYFTDNLGQFDKSFRRSNMLSLVDDTDPSVLSSRSNVKMVRNFVPTLATSKTYTIVYPTGIASPEDDEYTITSDTFVYSGKTGYLRNKLDSTTLQIIDIATGNAFVDDAGSFDPTNGTINLISFAPSSIVSGLNYITLVAVPSNQSVISPQRNAILKFDAGGSSSSAIITNTI
jgi:hypothetical protein